MGHEMKMGSKEKHTPGNFSAIATDLINSAPQSKLRYSDGSMDGDTRGIAASKGSLKPLKGNVSGLGNMGSQKSDYTKGYLKGLKSGMGEKKVNRILKKADRKAKKEERVANRAANRADRIEGRLVKTQRKGEKATEAGKLQKAKRLQARKQRLLKRQK